MSKRAGIQDEKVRKTEEVWECLVIREGARPTRSQSKHNDSEPLAPQG